LAAPRHACDDQSMERRMQASSTMDRGAEAARGGEHGACAVCGERDARMLALVELRGGEGAILCGSHALLYGRLNAPCASVTELKAALRDRRASERRASGEGDELAERLTAAFVRDRRTSERRAS
jgi:hypothetical protein